MSDASSDSSFSRPVRRQLSDFGSQSRGPGSDGSVSDDNLQEGKAWRDRALDSASTSGEEPQVHSNPPEKGIEQIVTEADVSDCASKGVASAQEVEQEVAEVHVVAEIQEAERQEVAEEGTPSVPENTPSSQQGTPSAQESAPSVDMGEDEIFECARTDNVATRSQVGGHSPETVGSTPEPEPAPVFEPMSAPACLEPQTPVEVGAEYEAGEGERDVTTCDSAQTYCDVAMCILCGVLGAVCVSRDEEDATHLSIIIKEAEGGDSPDTAWEEIATTARYVGLLDMPIIHTTSPDVDEHIISACTPCAYQTLPPHSTIFDESPSCLPILIDAFTSRVVLSPIDEMQDSPLSNPLSEERLMPAVPDTDACDLSTPHRDPYPAASHDTSAQVKVEDLQDEVETLQTENEDLARRLEDALSDKATTQRQMRTMTEENERLSREGHTSLATISQTEVRCKDAEEEARTLRGALKEMRSAAELDDLQRMYEREVGKRAEVSAQLEDSMNRVRELEMWGHKVRRVRIRGQRHVEARRGFEMREMAACDGTHSLVTVFQYDAYELMKEEHAAYAHIISMHHMEKLHALSYGLTVSLSDAFYAALLADNEQAHRADLASAAFSGSCSLHTNLMAACLSETAKLQDDLSLEVERRAFICDSLEAVTCEKKGAEEKLELLTEEVSHTRAVEQEKQELQKACERLLSKIESDDCEMLALRSEANRLRFTAETLEQEKAKLHASLEMQESQMEELENNKASEEEHRRQAQYYETSLHSLEGERKNLEIRLKSLSNEMAKVQRRESDTEAQLKGSKQRNARLGKEVEKLSQQLLKVPVLTRDVERLEEELNKAEAHASRVVRENVKLEGVLLSQDSEKGDLRRVVRELEEQLVVPAAPRARSKLVASSKYLQRCADVSLQEEVHDLRKKLQATELRAKLLMPSPEAETRAISQKSEYQSKVAEADMLRAEVDRLQDEVAALCAARPKEMQVLQKTDEPHKRFLIEETERITRHSYMTVLKGMLKTSHRVGARSLRLEPTSPHLLNRPHIGNSLDILAAKVDSCIASYSTQRAKRERRPRSESRMC